MLFMLVMPIWAMIYQLFVAPGWLVAGQVDYLLGSIGLATIALEIWMIIEAVKLFQRPRASSRRTPSTGKRRERTTIHRHLWRIV